MTLTRSHVALILTLAVIGAYGNTLQSALFWDDDLLVTHNTYLRNSTYVGAAFTSDLFHHYKTPVASHYRPLQTLTLMLDYWAYGLSPAGYHFTNILLHLACVLLLAAFVERLTGQRLLATGVALIFAVHPVNTNAIAYVSGRADPLAFAFCLGALLLLLRHDRSKSIPIYAGSIVCFIAALFSRENALLLPAIVFCVMAYSRGTSARLRDSVITTLPFVLVGILFVLWRQEVLSLQGKPAACLSPIPVLERMTNCCRAVATYVGLLVWPAHLQMDRQLPHGPWWIVAGALCLAAVAAALSWSRMRRPIVFLGLCWFVLTLAPMTGLLPLNAGVAEHWLYIPSVGLYLAIGSLLRPSKLAVGLIAVAVLALTCRTIDRNREWASPEAMFSQTRTAALQSVNAHCNFGQQLAANGQTNAAIAELESVEQLASGQTRAKTELATLYLAVGKLDEARHKVEEALTQQPESTTALLQLAMIADTQGDWRAARLAYTRAMSSTGDIRPWLQYGEALLKHHRYQEALDVVDAAQSIEPGSASVYNLLGALLAEQHRYELSAVAFKFARDLDRHAREANLNLARLAQLRDQQR